MNAAAPSPAPLSAPPDPGPDRVVRAVRDAFARMLAIVVSVQLFIHAVLDAVAPGLGGIRLALLDALLTIAVAAPALWLLVLGPYRRLALAELERAASRQREVLDVARHQDFVARFQAALDAAENEDDALVATRDAMEEVDGCVSAEVRLAPSAFSPLGEGVTCGHGQRCGVVESLACPAIRDHRTFVFPTGSSPDACPHVRSSGGPATSAVCIPITIDGQAMGVLRALGPEHDPPAAEQLLRLESMTAALGQRLRLVRALVSSERKANTDALTGLLNRRALESRLHEVLGEPGPACVALGDIDHFKRLNDTFGHEMGDRALRMLAAVMRSVLRPADVMARVGGEEFVVVLSGCELPEARSVLERLRSTLHARTADGARVPPFTVSWGVVEVGPGASAEELLRRADQAMYAAKRAGRDRVVVAG